jgi:hypothetical protein
MNDEVLRWLLRGDVSVQYQTWRDLLDDDRPDLQRRITTEGWGARFLSCQNSNNSWGRGFYQPKWTSSHYTLLDLRSLEADPGEPRIRDAIHRITTERKNEDGGIRHAVTVVASDVCLNGMYLSYACYFSEPQEGLESVIDFVLDQRLPDGGFNCRWNRSGARHSSVHSTLSVLEGMLEYCLKGYEHRSQDVREATMGAREFLLQHRLFRSDRTGQVIHPSLLRIPHPPRWKYNILRSLDYFRRAGAEWDERMADAMDVLVQKRGADGRWRLQAAHPGAVHFDMEEVGRPSRWNTLIALRVLKMFGSRYATTSDGD